MEYGESGAWGGECNWKIEINIDLMKHRRAKEKRLKKDAGRARWGQFFRNGSGSGNGGANGKDGGRSSKIDDLKDDLVINFPSGKTWFAAIQPGWHPDSARPPARLHQHRRYLSYTLIIGLVNGGRVEAVSSRAQSIEIN